MQQVKEIKNVRYTQSEKKTNSRIKVWEQIQLVVLALTICGQCIVGGFFLLGQSLWLIANSIAVVRDFKLRRPYADKVKDATMTAITIGIIAGYVLMFV